MKTRKNKTARKIAKQPRMRKDKEAHLLQVNRYITEFIHANKRFPKQVEIARAVGLSREAIRDLIKEVDLADHAGLHLTRLKLDDLLTALFDQGMRGNNQSSKLWLQLVFQWREQMDLKHSGEVKYVLSEEYKPDGL